MGGEIRLSAFADELGPDPALQFDTLARLGIVEIQLRGAWDKNVLDLSDDELRTLRSEADSRGLGYHAIGSPVGKTRIDAPVDQTLESLKRSANAARVVGCDRIRIFSFYRAPGQTPESIRHAVMDRMSKMAELARDEGVSLIHENEKDIYGDTAARCLDLAQSVPGISLCFDFANFVQVDERPIEAWKALADHVTYFDVKDAIAASGKVVPAGRGDGDVRAILTDALSQGFSDRLNLEPHLSTAGQFGGTTSIEQFEIAVAALREIIE
jgi:sugar phosphate isomerase/epimerase